MASPVNNRRRIRGFRNSDTFFTVLGRSSGKANAGGDLFEKRSSPRTPFPKTFNILAAPASRRSVFANPDVSAKVAFSLIVVARVRIGSPQRHHRCAPSARFHGGLAERLNHRVLSEYGADSLTKDPLAFSVNDSQIEDATFQTGFDVVVQQTRNLFGQEGVKIEDSVDGDLHGIVRAGLVELFVVVHVLPVRWRLPSWTGLIMGFQGTQVKNRVAVEFSLRS